MLCDEMLPIPIPPEVEVAICGRGSAGNTITCPYLGDALDPTIPVAPTAAPPIMKSESLVRLLFSPIDGRLNKLSLFVTSPVTDAVGVCV